MSGFANSTGLNSCSIVSGDASNCSCNLTVHPVTSSRISVWRSIFFIREPPPLQLSLKQSRPLLVNLSESPTGYCLASFKRECPIMTQSLLSAPTQRTATVVGGVWCARVCACVRACIHARVMCLQYTIIIFYPR